MIVVDSDTLAFIAAGAKINENNSGAGSEQDVYVSAGNVVKLWAAEGGIGGGIGGVAGAVDVGVIRNDTTAYIAASVNAKRDVKVNALAKHDIETVIVSVGVGVGGIAASVGVYTLGGNLNSAYSSEGKSSNSLNDSNGNTTSGYADTQAAGTKNSTMLSGYSATGSYNADRVSSAASSVNTKVAAKTPTNAASREMNKDITTAPRALPRGTPPSSPKLP